MNIVLIGMRGAGKTTVSKLLSKKLKKPYMETDDLVVKKAKMNIPKIIENHGWDYFRDVESEVVDEICQKDDIVISCGGGVVVRPKNIEALKKHGKIFWLKVSVPTLLERIGEDPNRPSLTGKKSRREDMEEVLKERLELYQNAACETIDTETNDAEKVTDIVISKI